MILSVYFNMGSPDDSEEEQRLLLIISHTPPFLLLIVYFLAFQQLGRIAFILPFASLLVPGKEGF